MYYRETLQLRLLAQVLESKELGALKMQVCKNTGSEARKLGKITHSKCFWNTLRGQHESCKITPQLFLRKSTWSISCQCQGGQQVSNMHNFYVSMVVSEVVSYKGKRCCWQTLSSSRQCWERAALSIWRAWCVRMVMRSTKAVLCLCSCTCLEPVYSSLQVHVNVLGTA